MNKKTNNSGWILCSSKSYPGKFYYFNIHNGEAAWCLNDNEKKILKRDIENTTYNYSYPEPVSPPNDPSPLASSDQIKTYLPTFGQAIFPKYISNVEQDMAIIWTPIHTSKLATNTQGKKQIDQNTQTELDGANVRTCAIPLSKRFEYRANNNSMEQKNSLKDWRVATNIGRASSELINKRKLKTKACLLKEPKLKRLQNKETETHQRLKNLDRSDLRFVLRAKRRKSVEIVHNYNKTNENFTKINTKSSTFSKRHGGSCGNGIDKAADAHTYTVRRKTERYLLADLDTLLENFVFINHYVSKDESCHLYIPRVVQKQLSSLSVSKNCSRDRVLAARHLLRRLDNYKTNLNLSKLTDESASDQIINNCLDIMKRNICVVLITKDTEMLETARLNNIRAYTINDITHNEDLVYNDNNESYKHKENLFLQNISDFDPLAITKTLSRNSYENSNDIDTASLMNDISNNHYLNDLSDINFNMSNLEISDRTLNVNVRKIVKNNLFDIKMDNSNRNETYKSYHAINDKSMDFEIQNRNLMTRKMLPDKKLKNSIKLTKTPVNDIFIRCESTNNDTVESRLESFRIRDRVMEHNLYTRLDEFVCSYEQIIGNFLDIILQKNLHYVSQPPPWSVHEGLEGLKEVYKENKYITNVIEILLDFYDFSHDNDKNIRPYNFMRLLGCGFCLVEALENSSPELSDTRNYLNYLKDEIQRPIEDLLVDSPVPHGADDEQTLGCNFIKNPSHVMEYLKKNFTDWKNCKDHNEDDIKHESSNDQSVKVLRTVGRHLNSLTINRSKHLSFTNKTDGAGIHRRNEVPRVLKNVKLLNEDKIKINIDNDHSNGETLSSRTTYGRSKSINNDRIAPNNYSINNDCQKYGPSINNDEFNDINDTIDNSGFVSSSLLAYSLVQDFFSELSTSFKMIHSFIDESIKYYSEDVSEESKKCIRDKANKTHTHIAEIMDKLKIIIQRESTESSKLKSLLIETGSDDKRTTRYKPVVMKCLEQAAILEHSLRSMTAVTDDSQLSVSDEDIRFINIYE